MKKNKAKWAIILLIVVLIAVIADIVVRLSVPASPELSLQYSKALMKVGMEDPNCANKLLKAANLTNVRIVPPGTLNARRNRRSIFIPKDG